VRRRNRDLHEYPNVRCANAATRTWRSMSMRAFLYQAASFLR
jgi:hypothetical protein